MVLRAPYANLAVPEPLACLTEPGIASRQHLWFFGAHTAPSPIWNSWSLKPPRFSAMIPQPSTSKGSAPRAQPELLEPPKRIPRLFVTNCQQDATRKREGDHKSLTPPPKKSPPATKFCYQNSPPTSSLTVLRRLIKRNPTKMKVTHSSSREHFIHLNKWIEFDGQGGRKLLILRDTATTKYLIPSGSKRLAFLVHTFKSNQHLHHMCCSSKKRLQFSGLDSWYQKSFRNRMVKVCTAIRPNKWVSSFKLY